MYYNKRDTKGRFTKNSTKTCKKRCKCTHKNVLNGMTSAEITEALIEDTVDICKTSSTQNLKEMFKILMDALNQIRIPEENSKDMMPFLKTMHRFYSLSIKTTIIAKELDKRAAEEAPKRQKECCKKHTKPIKDMKAFSLKGNLNKEDFFKLLEEAAGAAGFTDKDISDFLFMDLDTGEVCEGHRKRK